MKCVITEEIIYDYIDGELDDLTALFVNEHLAECKKCKENAAKTKQLFYELHSLEKEKIEIPSDLDAVYGRVSSICSEDKNGFTLKDFLSIQIRILKKQIGFIDFVPGKKVLKTSAQKLSKGSIQVSGLLLRQGYKIAFSRR